MSGLKGITYTAEQMQGIRKRLLAAEEQRDRLLEALKLIAHDGCQDVQHRDTQGADDSDTTCTERGHTAMACNACIAKAALEYTR
jgi:hypothetical protein